MGETFSATKNDTDHVGAMGTYLQIWANMLDAPPSNIYETP